VPHLTGCGFFNLNPPPVSPRPILVSIPRESDPLPLQVLLFAASLPFPCSRHTVTPSPKFYPSILSQLVKNNRKRTLPERAPFLLLGMFLPFLPPPTCKKAADCVSPGGFAGGLTICVNPLDIWIHIVPSPVLAWEIETFLSQKTVHPLRSFPSLPQTTFFEPPLPLF